MPIERSFDLQSQSQMRWFNWNRRTTHTLRTWCNLFAARNAVSPEPHGQRQMTRTSNPLSVRELAETVAGRVVGEGAIVIERIADLEYAGESEIAYVESANFL